MVKIILLIILVPIGIYLLNMLGNILMYHLFNIKTEVLDENIKYIDKKFGYSLTYPKDWIRSNGNFTDQGHLLLTPNKDKDTILSFWYKDAGKMSNIAELIHYVKEDAKWSKENYKIETISIGKGVFNNRDVVVWKNKEINNKDTIYTTVNFIADFDPPKENIIYVWIAAVTTTNKLEPDDKNEVENVLKSFNLLYTK